ncbi:MAG: O-antigen ligase family protein [Ignavibacterium sp.]|nr:O-antigen ligase family protein [Ignavibacterium sp.]MDW8374639.1 O-antigen ligase family protein [Ignavibacteriales bacterium]
MTILSEINKIKFLILFQILILILSAKYNFIPFYLTAGFLFLCWLIYYTFNNPASIIYILIFSAFIDSLFPLSDDIYGPSILVLEILLVIFVGVITIRFFSDIHKLKNIPNYILNWIPYLAWSLIIGLIVAVDKYRVISFWKNYFAGFFIFSLTYYSIKNKDQLKSLIVAIILWGVTLSLLEFKVLIELGGFSKGLVGLFIEKNLLNVGWGQSNYLAAFFVLIIPYSIGYLLYVNKKSTKFYISFAILIMFFALILTLSRGGILALIISLSILSLRFMNAKFLLTFLGILLAAALILAFNPLTYVLIERISALEASGSFYSRINFYIDVWNAFLKNPLTGVGFGNLSYYAIFIFPKEVSPSAHNILLGALGEIGIIGTIFYFSLIFSVLIAIYKRYKAETNDYLKILRWCFFISIIGALIHTLVEPTLDSMHFSLIFWIIAAINLKLDLFTQNETQVEKS